jgi:hypothetical protein
MPQTREVKRPTMTVEQIARLIDSIEGVHDLCLMSVALCCPTPTSETPGLTWRSYDADKTHSAQHGVRGTALRRQAQNAGKRKTLSRFPTT